MCVRLFDAHCHLADARLAHCDTRELLAEARAAGVRHLVVNGTCESDWRDVTALAASSRGVVVPALGLHPWRVAAASPSWAEALQAALEQNPKRCAVGEAGLHQGTGCDATPAQQAAALAVQLRLAAQLRRPATLHCVRAHGAMHAALLTAAPAAGFADSGLLLHGYSGSAEMVPRFAALGAHFSFSAALAGMAPARAAALVQAVPEDRLLLETDAPDGLPRGGGALQLRHAPAAPPRLAFGTPPCGCEGAEDAAHGAAEEQREAPPLNHPANLRAVLQLVARLRGIEEEALAALAWRNSRRLFRACLEDDDDGAD